MNAFARRLRGYARGLVPHGYLALLLVLDGLLLVRPVAQKALEHARGNWFDDWITLINAFGVLALPQALAATGLTMMSFGIALRARVAWVLSLVLLAGAASICLWGDYRSHALAAFSIALACALIYYWRRFDRASIAAGSLFAFLSIGSLIVYAVFGSLYLGDDFAPPIHNLVTAFYFSIVSMSTVGYGDIVPHSDTARLFTASIIVLGITVFATSISAVIGPVIGGHLKRIVKGGISNVTRKNHYLIVGASPLAHSVYAGLVKRGYTATVIVAPNTPHTYPDEADLIVGDASDTADNDSFLAASWNVLRSERQCDELLRTARRAILAVVRDAPALMLANDLASTLELASDRLLVAGYALRDVAFGKAGART